MAAQARELRTLRCRMGGFDSINNFLMTGTASLLGDVPAVGLDLNIILVAAGGEKKRMPETVRSLGEIFADEICRSMTAIAGRNCAMRRFDPAIKLLLHDMAVGAGRRIVSEVGPTLGIGKGVRADTDGDANHHPEQDALDHARSHLEIQRLEDWNIGMMEYWP